MGCAGSSRRTDGQKDGGQKDVLPAATDPPHFFARDFFARCLCLPLSDASTPTRPRRRVHATLTARSGYVNKSRDLLWQFDAVTRLAEAQLAHAWHEAAETVRARLAIRYFVIPGPLWWVFNWESASVQSEEAAHRQAAQVDQWTPPQLDGGDPKKGCVLLVDEIDKAESDLPNGLLEALGAGQFTPFGCHDPVVADAIPPLVVITTNEERALPDAFVRRCLVLPLSLPGPLSLPQKENELIALLADRGRAHFPDLDAAILDRGARQLVADRKKAIEQRWRPLPGQAEYLDLLRAIRGLAPGDSQAQERMMNRIGTYVLRKQAGNSL